MKKQDNIQLHHAFWNREPLKRPLVSFHIGQDFFFSRHYRAAQHLLVNGKQITPDMLDVDMIFEKLPQTGIFLNPVLPDTEQANAFMNHLERLSK